MMKLVFALFVLAITAHSVSTACDGAADLSDTELAAYIGSEYSSAAISNETVKENYVGKLGKVFESVCSNLNSETKRKSYKSGNNYVQCTELSTASSGDQKVCLDGTQENCVYLKSSLIAKYTDWMCKYDVKCTSILVAAAGFDSDLWRKDKVSGAKSSAVKVHILNPKTKCNIQCIEGSELIVELSIEEQPVYTMPPTTTTSTSTPSTTTTTTEPPTTTTTTTEPPTTTTTTTEPPTTTTTTTEPPTTTTTTTEPPTTTTTTTEPPTTTTTEPPTTTTTTTEPPTTTTTTQPPTTTTTTTTPMPAAMCHEYDSVLGNWRSCGEAFSRTSYVVNCSCKTAGPIRLYATKIGDAFEAAPAVPACEQIKLTTSTPVPSTTSTTPRVYTNYVEVEGNISFPLNYTGYDNKEIEKQALQQIRKGVGNNVEVTITGIYPGSVIVTFKLTGEADDVSDSLVEVKKTVESESLELTINRTTTKVTKTSMVYEYKVQPTPTPDEEDDGMSGGVIAIIVVVVIIAIVGLIIIILVVFIAKKKKENQVRSDSAQPMTPRIEEQKEKPPQKDGIANPTYNDDDVM